MRTFRHARLFAAAGITLATLALTACDNGTGTKDEGASKLTPTAPASPTDDTKGSQPTNSDSGKPSQTNQTTEKTNKTTDQTDKSTSNPAICNGSNTKVTAQPVSRPLNHMLLTVTNTGSKACSLMYYPVIRFDEMQWVPQPMPDSKPQAVPTLSPGASGYAGVLLAAADGSGDGGTTGKKLTIAFQGGTPNTSGGASATPPLPAKGVYYDSSMSVTYWQSDMANALN
ncbi:DUF4232 domain-containing protein [Streptomyces sp. GESEQ-4]|uniref:DUF4232 domain-containing protein n=1 Tax=Streptomyces sp. GESEQ-4 TaxID=2812655 RepID=UPI001B33ED0B|nr:DUF4232 domain-containing protein [Streptomyces sp. GESEQ-4]